METTFDTALDRVAGVQGWLTDAQARRLWERAVRLEPPARIVEIGSFQGRSTIVLASGAPSGVEITAIDPHAGNDRGPQEIAGYVAEAESDFAVFHANLARAGVADRVRHVRRFSSEALADVAGEIDLLYIDGAHRYRPALDDLRRWGARVRDGGTLLVHDSFSSIGVTLALATALFFGRRFRYVGRTGSLAEYQRDDLDRAERFRNATRQLAQLPWFARNVLVKALIVARLGRFGRLLGHDGTTWPY